jgi:hypothetical protein
VTTASEFRQERERLVNVADSLIDVADQNYASGNDDDGRMAGEIAGSLLDLALNFIPGVNVANDLYQAFTGETLGTQEKLSPAERAISAISAVTGGFLSQALGVTHVGMAVAGIIRSVDRVDKLGDSARTAGLVERVFDSAKEIGWGASELKTLSKSASDIKRFGPLERGILHDIPTPSGGSVAETFRSSSYFEVVSKEPVKMYRVYGGGAGELAPYWSRTKPTGPLQAQLDAAILPDFRNTAAKWVEIEVPAGTKFFDGAASPQYLHAHGSNIPVGQLLGGGNQVYIPRVDRGWITGGGAF